MRLLVAWRFSKALRTVLRRNREARRSPLVRRYQTPLSARELRTLIRAELRSDHSMEPLQPRSLAAGLQRGYQGAKFLARLTHVLPYLLPKGCFREQRQLPRAPALRAPAA